MDIHSIDRTFDPGDKGIARWPQIFMLGYHKRTTAAEVLGPHRNPGFEICYAVDGEFDWTVEGKLTRIRTGETSLTLPWELHSGHENVVGKGHLAWIIIRPETFTKNGKLTLGPWSSMSRTEQRSLGNVFSKRSSAFIGNVAGIDTLFASLYEEITAREIGFVSRVNAVVDEMLIRSARALLSPANTAQKCYPAVDRVLEHMRSDIGRKWKLSELAREAHLGTTAFALQVKRITRFSPMDYLMKLRVERAKEILSTDGTVITDLALDLGFASSQHFTTMFRKYAGVTPSTYRKKHTHRY